MPPPHHHDHHHHHHHHHHEMEDWEEYDWHELPPHLKDAATTLGWDQKLWDESGLADTEDLDWGELSHEQQKAAEKFGYHPKLWDETELYSGHHGPHHHHGPPHHHHHHHHDHGSVSSASSASSASSKSEEEKKDGEDDKKEESSSGGGKNSSSSDNKKKKDKPTFKLSKSYGGDGGDKFDHGTNRHISKLTVYSDGHVVTGLEVKYANTTKTSGKCGGKATSFDLEKGECITAVTVRSNKYVQSLEFKTNKLKVLGPVGGKGWGKMDLRGNDTEGEEVKVNAPFKYQLCGFTGREGKLIDQIAFHWGPVPN